MDQPPTERDETGKGKPGRFSVNSRAPEWLQSMGRMLRHLGPWAAMAATLIGALLILGEALQSGLRKLAVYVDDEKEG